MRFTTILANDEEAFCVAGEVSVVPEGDALDVLRATCVAERRVLVAELATWQKVASTGLRRLEVPA